MKNFRIFFLYLLLIHIDYLIKKENFEKQLKKLSLHKLKCLS
jgi:hypothetical protein